MGRKRKTRKSIKQTRTPYEDLYKENKRRIYSAVLGGKLDEEDRAFMAREIALIEASRVFARELKTHAARFNTNIGLLLDQKVKYPSFPTTLIIPGTGDNGENEHILFQLNAELSDVESWEDHKKRLNEVYGDRSKYTDGIPH